MLYEYLLVVKSVIKREQESVSPEGAGECFTRALCPEIRRMAMLTKGAIGNLVNRYRAVLKKCNLMNTFGSLAVASMLTRDAP